MSYVLLGAGGGLGRTIAARLAKRDALLILSGRSREHLIETERTIRASNERARVHLATVDVSSVKSIDEFILSIQSLNEPLRGLINTSAAFYKGSFMDQNLSSIDELLETTYGGVVRLIARVIKNVRRASTFYVVNVTSVSAATNLDSGRSSALHIATKAALQTFGVVVGREVCNQGIRICGIAPGTFARKGNTGIPEDVIADSVEFLIDLPPSTWIESLVIRPTGIDSHVK